mgnify:CR=1 FL=1
MQRIDQEPPRLDGTRDQAVRPRGLTASEVATLLGRSRSWFYAHRDRLEAAGFPKPNRITGRWDRVAIDTWCDRFDAL